MDADNSASSNIPSGNELAQANAKPADGQTDNTPTRRDFLFLTAGAMGALGAAIFAVPLIDTMNPAADTLAQATVDIDLKPVAVGQAITIVWQGKPVFIRHRTPEEIKAAESVNVSDLRDPQKDSARVTKPEWLVMVGICTHLGCIPLGQKKGDPKGEFGGWFCPCHGSQYDTSGRIRKGPAPKNLLVPDYYFTSATAIKIGAKGGAKPEGKAA